MQSPPKPPPFDVLLAMIKASTSAADLAALLVTAQTYFMGNQREALEEVIAARTEELPDAGLLV